jgi:hypothetical protein
MAALREVEDASRLTGVLQELVDLGLVEATAPPRSPNRRYRAVR